MLLGMMNDPARKVGDELRFAAEAGFDFLDLTLEPPKARVEDINIEKVLKLSELYNLKLVGHTSFYLQWASPVKNVYDGTLKEIEETFALLEELKVEKVTLHPHWFQPNSSQDEILSRNIKSLRKIVKLGEKYSLKVLLENIPNGFLSYPENFEKIFSQVQGLYFHLDIGHFSAVALRRGLSPEKELDKFLKNFRHKLLHVHISDAKKEVDHLPLGVGVIDWKKCLDLLQEIKYEGTLTLEVFVKDREYLLISKRKLEKYLSSSID